MPRRKDEHSRALGPVWIPSKQRWRVVVIEGTEVGGDGRPTARWFAGEEEAQSFRSKVDKRLARLTERTVGESIDAYEKFLEEKGTVGFKETIRRIRLFFESEIDAPLGRIEPERCKEMYQEFRQRKRQDGEPISVDYHRATLINARSLFTWCVDHGWMPMNPLAGVKGVGKRSAGKDQLTGDEAAKLYAHCLSRAESGDRAALGLLMALLMALRSSDITRRVVRDVDLGGTVLRVSGGKTKKSNRPRRIPVVLRPMVATLVAGRDPFEPLFPLCRDGEIRHHTRRWLEQAMERFCKKAGVPYVCPHALKGMAGSTLAEEGELADRIAEHLSHTSKKVSERHYIAPGVLEDAQAERMLRVISGGRG